jgi:hypothetical protein
LQITPGANEILAEVGEDWRFPGPNSSDVADYNMSIDEIKQWKDL